MEASGLRELRQELLTYTTGSVLEVGCGNGMNFIYYAPDKVSKVIAVDPEKILIQEANKNAKKATVAVELVNAQSEKLPFKDECFDCVVFTLVLCSVKDPLKSINEACRVLKKGGTVVVLEHIISSSPKLKKAQELANFIWPHFAGGCQLTRNTPEIVNSTELSPIKSKLFSFKPSKLAILTSPMAMMVLKK